MVGQRIKTYLDDNGIKQSFLSDKTDIPQSVLSLMLKGTRRIEITQYYKICLALNVDMTKFLED